jgi:DNA excision repair protein ERCC-6
MLQHWLKELAVWAPGLRRVLIHQSAGEKESRRSISRQLLQSLCKWLERVRADRVNECIDEEDRLSMAPHSFCGTGYVIVTTYENVRRNPDIYIQHSWSYVVLDEGTSF